MRTATTLLASCALMFSVSAFSQSRPCTEKCEVIITMSAGCGSGIKVAPDPIFVARNATVEITWTVQNEDWTFDANGIAIHLEATTDFPKGEVTRSVHKRTHKNKGPKVFKYDVNLVGPGGKCQLDPTIVDQ
jgi:hypothetical protein